MARQVIVYTTPTCPDCRTLKAWLTARGLAFEERDLTDPAIMAEAKARTGVRVAPITLIGDQVFYGTFASQKPGIAEALGLGGSQAVADKHVDIHSASRVISVPDGRTLLDAALDERIPYPHGCRSGRCGSCKSRLIAGEVDLLDHTRFALSNEEKAQGLILACRALPRTDLAVAWLGGDEEVADHPVRHLQARIVGIEDATHDIKRIRLTIEAEDPLAFSAGQYARLTFPGAPPRDCSMANWPDDPELEFHVRRVPGGAATERIHGRVRIGDLVRVEGPFGSSYLREKHAGPMLCIAGGSGLAPIKSIVEAALARGLKQPIRLYFGVRTERDLYLVDHFEGLEARYTNVTFTPVLSDAAPQRAWRTGLVTDAVAQDLKDLDGWKAYVAGPPAMAEAAMEVTKTRGLRPEDLHADIFFTPEEIAT